MMVNPSGLSSRRAARSVRSPGHAPAYLESRIASMDLDSTSDLIDSQSYIRRRRPSGRGGAAMKVGEVRSI